MQALALSQPKRYKSTNGASVEKKTWLLVISSVKYREELITKRGLCVGVLSIAPQARTEYNDGGD